MMWYDVYNDKGKIMKVHLGDSKIASGEAMELSWQRLLPSLEYAFRLCLSETIDEIQLTENGIRVKIGQR